MWTRPRWGKFFSLPLRRQRLLVEAAVCLGAARLALAFLPFPKIGKYLGQLRPPAPESVVAGADQAMAKEIGWAVTRAATVLPFRAVCLPQALAAWQMLHVRHVPSRLHFGAARSKEPRKPLATHAWLDASGVPVTGYPVAHEFVELGYFTR